MTAIDRLRGLSGDVAIKAPCRAATTANITLNGLQTVDGVVLATDDRVLVWNQSSAVDNGIYRANTSNWQRDVDFSGIGDSVQGTVVLVVEGSAYAGVFFQLTTVSPIVGTTSLTFVVAGPTAVSISAVPVLATGSSRARTLPQRFADVINVLDEGADPTGVAASTVALTAAAARVTIAAAAGRGTAVIFPSGTYLSGPVVFPAGTRLVGVGKVVITDVAGSTGDLITLNGDDCAADNLTFNYNASPALGGFLRVKGNRYDLSRITTNGGVFNALLPNSYPAPVCGVRVQGTTVTQYIGGRMRDVVANGGRNGIIVQGGSKFDFNTIRCNRNASFGMVLGNTLPAADIVVDGFSSDGCGQYGFSLSFITSAASISPYPYKDIYLNLTVKNCGWNAYYTGDNATLGSGKYCVDIADTGLRRLVLRGQLTGGHMGGVELKYSVPSGVTLVPSGKKNMDVDLQVMLTRDSGQGVAVSNSTVGETSADLAEIQIRGATTVVSQAWSAGMPHGLYDVVQNDGYDWLFAGTNTGADGTSGATPPLGGKSVVLTTNAATLVGDDVLNFASTTSGGVIAEFGMTVFAGPNLPDGATVTNVTATTVTVSAPATGSGIASGRNVVFAWKKNDDVCNWLGLGVSTIAAPVTSVGYEVRASTNVSVDAKSIGCSRGLYINAFDSTDNTVYNCRARMIVRGALYGIQLANSTGTGAVSDLHLNQCDVEASGVALLLGTTGNTDDVKVHGGRYVATGSGSYALGFSGGTATVSLDGGVQFVGVDRAVFMNAAGTYTVEANFAGFSAGVAGFDVVRIDGAGGTWNWGVAAQINNKNAANYPGWALGGGAAITVSGRVLRTDLTTAPAGTQKASVGEHMFLAAPTATVDGYVCTGGTYTWKEKSLA